MAPLQFEYQPLPVFVPFHLDGQYEAALAGGYGSGKSVALTADAIELGLNQPGSEILICRRTIPSLKDTTEKIFVNHLPTDFLAACDISRVGGHINTLRFPNGSIYYFRGLDDWTKLKSMTVAAIYYDEADEIEVETYEGLLSRVRQVKPTTEARALGAPNITRRKIRLAFNPAGHNWIWQRFIGPARKERSAWHKSTSLDNPYNPIEYIQSLLDMPDPWVRRYVLCDFDDFGGQIYENFSYDTHVVPNYVGLERPYAYPPTGFFVMGMDPGTRDPTAAVWCYFDQEHHRLVAVAQYQAHSLAADVHAASWRAVEQRHNMRVRKRIGDPHAVTVRDRGSNVELSSIYGKLGYHFSLGPTREQDRILALGTMIEQRRFVVTQDCLKSLDDDGTSLFDRIRDYQWKDLTPLQLANGGAQEKPLKKNTHLVECAQFCASQHLTRPTVTARAERELTEAEHHAREVSAAIRKRMLSARSATTGHALGTMPL